MIGTLRNRIITYLGSVDIFNCLLILCAMLAPQRVLLSPFDAYICVVTFLISLVYYYSNKQKYHTLLIISLFLSVDNGDVDFAETASLIRYIIYFAVIFALFNNLRLDKKKLVFALCLLLIPITLMIFHLDHISRPTLNRDGFLSVLAIIVLCSSNESLKTWNIDLKLLVGFLIVYLCSELVNILFFYGGYTTGYASYDSTKALVVLPSLYYLRKDNFIATLVLVPLTIFILYGYITRMITLTYLAIIIFYIVSKAIKLGKKEIIFSLFLALIGMTIFNNLQELGYIKLIGSLTRASQELSIEDMARVVDEGRTEQIKIIANQDIFHMLFGNGFGSGFYDQFGVFRFVQNDGSGFTEEELRTNYYYNFHDIWSDIAYRFGLLSVILAITTILKKTLSRDTDVAFHAMLLWVLVFCSFFSTAGLLLIAMLWMSFRASRLTSLEPRQTLI